MNIKNYINNKINENNMKVNTTITIEDSQMELVREKCINLSAFVRKQIAENL